MKLAIRPSAAHRNPRGSTVAGVFRHSRAVAEPLEARLCLAALFTPLPGTMEGLGTSAVGDFNGDGIPDLAAIDETPKATTLSVLLSNGHGGFTAAQAVPINIGGIVAPAAGDFTGNGRSDVAVANNSNGFYANGTVSVYLSNGNGSLSLARGSPIAVGNFPAAVAAGDLTGNGRADLVVANEMSGNVTVLLSNGDGTFTPAPGSPYSVNGGPSAVALGDFTGDGKLDIAVAQISGGIEVFAGNGSGGFSPSGRVSMVPLSGITSMVAGDFNGDGRLDLAAADGFGGLSILLNKGNGTFSLATAVAMGSVSGSSSIAGGDFNGNGRQDLAVGYGGNVSILLGSGNGAFARAVGSPLSGDLVAGGEFDGNNEPDLVVDNADGSASVLVNTTPPGLPTGTLGAILSARVPASIVAGTRAAGPAAVKISAPTGEATNGTVSISLFASPDLSLFDATQVTATARFSLKLKPVASKTLRLPISLFPTAPAGTYRLIAAVEAPDGSTTAVAGPVVTIVKPLVAVLASNVAASAAVVAPGARMSLSLALRNAGNVSAAGATTLTVSLSAGPSGADASPLATVPLRVKLAAGRSRAYRIRFKLPAGTAPGTYYMVASLDVSAFGDPDAADGIAVSRTPITVR